MSNIFKFFKNTNNEIFVKLDNILFIPFGIDYIFDGSIPLQMETCYSDGVILKYNVPCAAINTNEQEKSPIRIKDIVTLLPNVDILPLSDERFKLKNPKNEIQKKDRVAKKYLDYLVDVYKENTGEYKGGEILCGSKLKSSEEAFIDVYFELCYQQLKDAEKEFSTKGIRKEAEEIFERSLREGWRGHSSIKAWEEDIWDGYMQYGWPYPFNDARVLFEILLPLHSARMSFLTSDVGNTMRQYRPSQSVFDKTIHEGLVANQELVPNWSAVNPRVKLKNQTNKDRVSFYEMDFLFWDGQQFIGVELDGDSKKLADYSAKKENLEKCANFTLRNLSNKDLAWLINHFNTESSPDLELRTQTLSALFSQTILKFWDTVEENSPLRKLNVFDPEDWDESSSWHGEYEEEDRLLIAKSKLEQGMSQKLPWHLRYTEGYIYLDDPTE